MGISAVKMILLDKIACTQVYRARSFLGDNFQYTPRLCGNYLGIVFGIKLSYHSKSSNTFIFVEQIF